MVVVVVVVGGLLTWVIVELTRATHIMPISPPICPLCYAHLPLVSPIIHSQLPPTMLIIMLTLQDTVVDSNNFIA